MRKTYLTAVYIAGILSGLLIAAGISTFFSREPGNFGGEILIMPLLVLVFVLGFCMRSSLIEFFPELDPKRPRAKKRR